VLCYVDDASVNNRISAHDGRLHRVDYIMAVPVMRPAVLFFLNPHL
jgi:hypothetical protein